jgi:hypothetical protein
MKRSSCETYLGRQRAFFGFVALAIHLLTINSMPSMAQKTEQPGWHVELEEGKSTRSNLSINNRCSAPHVFRVKNKIKYLRFEQAADSILVGANSTKEIGVQFDATGLKSKKYRDKLLVECLDCKKEKTCRQDREELLVEMIVIKAKQIANRVALNCIPARSPNCDPSQWGGCLIMFPPNHATLSEAMRKGGQAIEGTAWVRSGATPALIYEFIAAPPYDKKTLPVDKDTRLDEATAKALGFESVTILKGQYLIDPKIGKLGGVIFKVAQTAPVDGVPLNPYEQVGKDHNAGLRAVMSQLQIKDKEDKRTVKARADIIMSEWLRTYLKRNEVSARFSVKQTEELINQASTNLQGPPPTIDPIKQFGHEAGGAYVELTRIADSTSSIAEFDKRVYAVESRLLKRKDDKNAAPVLVAAAVMRNSAHFWAEEFPRVGPTTAPLRIKWKKVALLDAAGALSGFISGGVAGAVGGGLGASLGEIIGEL